MAGPLECLCKTMAWNRSEVQILEGQGKAWILDGCADDMVPGPWAEVGDHFGLPSGCQLHWGSSGALYTVSRW